MSFNITFHGDMKDQEGYSKGSCDVCSGGELILQKVGCAEK